MKDNIGGRPGLLVAAEALGYVIGGLCVLEVIGNGDPAVMVTGYLVGGSIVAAAIFMRKGENWARITFTALAGLLILAYCSVADEDATGVDFLLLGAEVCAIVFSWTPRANQWFRLMANQQHPSNENVTSRSHVCKKCGALVSSDSRFCTHCGTAVEAEAQNMGR